MEIKGIDVSAHQGKINWDTVANYGMDFAILRITEVGNVIDSQFENNFAGCNKRKIPVGVYKYSYASTVSEAQSEARKVVSLFSVLIALIIRLYYIKNVGLKFTIARCIMYLSI